MSILSFIIFGVGGSFHSLFFFNNQSWKFDTAHEALFDICHDGRQSKCSNVNYKNEDEISQTHVLLWMFVTSPGIMHQSLPFLWFAFVDNFCNQINNEIESYVPLDLFLYCLIYTDFN